VLLSLAIGNVPENGYIDGEGEQGKGEEAGAVLLLVVVLSPLTSAAERLTLSKRITPAEGREPCLRVLVKF